MRVTRILTACGLREWPACISEADREFYLTRGAAIHTVTELLDREVLDESTVDERIKGFLNAWKNFRRLIGGKILAIEEEVKHKTLGYEGRLDRRLGPCAICRHASVVDIKTNEADEPTRLQLMGYNIAKGGRYKRMSVSLFEDGNFKPMVYDNDVFDKKAWLACVMLAAWRQRNGYTDK